MAERGSAPSPTGSTRTSWLDYVHDAIGWYLDDEELAADAGDGDRRR